MHHKPLSGRALPGPVGGAYSASTDHPNWTNNVGPTRKKRRIKREREENKKSPANAKGNAQQRRKSTTNDRKESGKNK